ncbi:hypothetical protein PWEIH_10848 [Listeria weihenstephanensis FSL R9-0317]|uniref:J domain-containing protein n=1 Tax=Listeria weihenstephanensis TaxID=1006155 RepID=UPI0003E891DE|nr:J domain-containing protein [Listeria weihenstephanensis]EUJ37183.1 hypothetical protein PWEIH_10848 [Listeria weihenstephanensis FSL R9-0317]
MTCWEILNIEITTDRKKIKSAYAKKLKITHPDDDIEAFQELKEAFDQALAYAKNDQADGSKLREEIIIWEDTNETPIAVEDDFEERIQALCQSYNTRIDVSAWKKILAESMDWDMYQYETYRECIKTLLLDYYTIMSRPVIRLLFEHFQLWETDGSYYYEAEDYIFENYAEEIYDAPDFAFDTLGDLKGVVLDQFLTLRYALYRSIKQEKFTEAEKIAEQASAIYALDADLVVLQGMILFEKGLENLQDYGATFKRSFAYFNKALRLNAKNVTARFYTILIKTKNAERLEAADRLFLKDVQGGYVLHVELLTGFIYYFGKEYGEAIPFWAELSKEQQAQIKKRMDLRTTPPIEISEADR